MTRFLLNSSIAVSGLVCVGNPDSAAAGQITVDLSHEGALSIIGDKDPNSVFIRVDNDFNVSSHTAS